ncbi:MAG: presqualene diphosphate synthase HpnD, partial [Rhodospirillaceae bacterium]|nr:presqualene diphosphate synthase HpnD [Rhodospirillaceae bacterium]
MPQDRLEYDIKEGVLAIVQRSGTSFYWAMRLLPPAKRDAMFAIYAFCREVDDIADGEEALETKRINLQIWRDEIDKLYDGTPNHLITRALAEPLRLYGLAKEDFVAVIDGMETDAIDKLQLQDMAELELYCDRVACAVGRLSNAVFGLAPEKSRQLAKSLGEALQLTNILRDIYEDAERDRIYLPKELLARHGVLDPGIPDPDINEILAHPGLVEVCIELAERARLDFQQAQAIIETCDKTAIRPAIVMMKIYRRLFILLE